MFFFCKVFLSLWLTFFSSYNMHNLSLQFVAMDTTVSLRLLHRE